VLRGLLWRCLGGAARVIACGGAAAPHAALGSSTVRCQHWVSRRHRHCYSLTYAVEGNSTGICVSRLISSMCDVCWLGSLCEVLFSAQHFLVVGSAFGKVSQAVAGCRSCSLQTAASRRYLQQAQLSLLQRAMLWPAGRRSQLSEDSVWAALVSVQVSHHPLYNMLLHRLWPVLQQMKRVL
jgi:hypothetical protein